ncbi:hypothetical protein GCM10007416_35620 [Kroppenstedtia guangzhouensis]|uniref:Ribbon-helix-helix protein, copG family n=1 Tax=Kroppenstedtia guangzhouensis TaxID=1274356 RepID=A0ABQ1H7H7_9BACL|nr:hypothetical protein GCM10007416_35620 [Kroppenstedtia guangzhouensis]
MMKKQVKVYMSDDLRKWLKIQAAKEGTTISEIVERLVEEYRAEKKSP